MFFVYETNNFVITCACQSLGVDTMVIRQQWNQNVNNAEQKDLILKLPL